jgi:hypothetical protein
MLGCKQALSAQEGHNTSAGDSYVTGKFGDGVLAGPAGRHQREGQSMKRKMWLGLALTLGVITLGAVTPPRG